MATLYSITLSHKPFRNPIPAKAQAAYTRRAGAMKRKGGPRGGNTNTQRDLLAELEEEEV